MSAAEGGLESGKRAGGRMQPRVWLQCNCDRRPVRALSLLLLQLRRLLLCSFVSRVFSSQLLSAVGIRGAQPVPADEEAGEIGVRLLVVAQMGSGAGAQRQRSKGRKGKFESRVALDRLADTQQQPLPQCPQMQTAKQQRTEGEGKG